MKIPVSQSPSRLLRSLLICALVGILTTSSWAEIIDTGKTSTVITQKQATQILINLPNTPSYVTTYVDSMSVTVALNNLANPGNTNGSFQITFPIVVPTTINLPAQTGLTGMINETGFIPKDPTSGLQLYANDWLFKSYAYSVEPDPQTGIFSGAYDMTAFFSVVHPLDNGTAEVYLGGGHAASDGLAARGNGGGGFGIVNTPYIVQIPPAISTPQPPTGSLSIDKSMVGQNGTVNITWSVKSN